MSTSSVSPSRIQVVGAILNALGTLAVIAACFLPIFYVYSANFDPISLSINTQGVYGLDVFLLLLTVFFEGLLALAWGYAFIAHKLTGHIRPLAMIITLTGSVLSFVVFGSTLLSTRKIPIAPGLWLMVAGYALSMVGLVLLTALSLGKIRIALCAVLLATALAGGVASASSALTPPQFLQCSRTQTASAPTPNIFADDGTQLNALHANDGTRAWGCSYFNYAINPLAATQGMVLGSGGTNIFAFSTTDGALRWKHPTRVCTDQNSQSGFQAEATMVTADSVVFLIRCETRRPVLLSASIPSYVVLALRLSDGAQEWQRGIAESNLLGMSNDLVLFDTTGNPIPPNQQGKFQGQILALHMADGTAAWQATDDALTLKQNVVLIAQPNGTLAALNAADGTPRWHSAIVIEPSQLLHAQLIDGTTIVENTFYASTSDANNQALLVAVRVADGKQLWAKSFGKIIDNVMSNATTVFVRATLNDDTETFSALRATDGAPLWHNDQLAAAPSLITDNAIYVVQTNAQLARSLQALNATDGAMLWQANATMQPQNILGLADGVLYVSSHTNQQQATIGGIEPAPEIIAVRASDGAILWQGPTALAVLLPGSTLAYL